MARALSEMTVTGVTTNIPMLRRVMASGPFRSGKYDTGTVENHPELATRSMSEDRRHNVALIAATLAHVLRQRRGFPDRPEASHRSSWIDGFRPRESP